MPITIPHINIMQNPPIQADLHVVAVETLPKGHVLLRLTSPESSLPDIKPGQFVEVRVEGSPRTFLRRPISVNFVDRDHNELWLLVHIVGDGTRTLGRLKEGSKLDCIFPLGQGFWMPMDKALPQEKHILLVGGGVGTAPLLYYGHELRKAGAEVAFLLGGRTKDDILQRNLFEHYGEVHLTTEDGSAGVRGFVTHHPALKDKWTRIATCGPKPMMWAVAHEALKRGIECELSLENLMACGLGACLCCVEKTRRGNLCVCKEGPVFNAKELIID